jgi:hypothetical protein
MHQNDCKSCYALLVLIDAVFVQGLACITDTVPYKEKLMYSSLLLPCFCVVLLLPCVFADIWYKQSTSVQDVKVREKCWDYFYFSILFIVFTAYPAVSRNILSTFACANLGADGNFLRADMRLTCPSAGDFNTTWAAVFTCLIPAGVPVILLLVMVSHGVAALATKKRHLSLLQGLLQTFKTELSDAALKDLLSVLNTVDASHRSEEKTMHPIKWLHLASDAELINQQADTLRTVLKYTYPYGKEDMTFAELIKVVRAHEDTLMYMPSNNFEEPDDESILLVLLAFTVRKLGEYSRGAAERSTSLFSLIYKAHKQPGDDNDNLKADTEDKQQWVKVFDENIISFKPIDSKNPDHYPGIIHKLQAGGVCKSRKDFLKELAQQLYIQAEKMHSVKLLSLQEASWDASKSASQLERKIVLRLGFLFQSYRPGVWYFEVVEIIRKLIMASVLIFVYEGTASQIVTGFMVTLVALLLSLWLRPFNDDSLQGMYQWSLFVQTITLLSGVMVKAEQFMEILGEKGGPGMTALGIILVVLHVLVAVTPVLDAVFQTLSLKYVAMRRNGQESIMPCRCCAIENIEEGEAIQEEPEATHCENRMPVILPCTKAESFIPDPTLVFINSGEGRRAQQHGQDPGLQEADPVMDSSKGGKGSLPEQPSSDSQAAKLPSFAHQVTLPAFDFKNLGADLTKPMNAPPRKRQQVPGSEEQAPVQDQVTLPEFDYSNLGKFPPRTPPRKGTQGQNSDSPTAW